MPTEVLLCNRRHELYFSIKELIMKPFGLEYLEPMAPVEDVNGALGCSKTFTFVESTGQTQTDLIC
jgi:hypothetical protein